MPDLRLGEEGGVAKHHDGKTGRASALRLRVGGSRQGGGRFPFPSNLGSSREIDSTRHFALSHVAEWRNGWTGIWPFGP